MGSKLDKKQCPSSLCNNSLHDSIRFAVLLKPSSGPQTIQYCCNHSCQLHLLQKRHYKVTLLNNLPRKRLYSLAIAILSIHIWAVSAYASIPLSNTKQPDLDQLRTVLNAPNPIPDAKEGNWCADFVCWWYDDILPVEKTRSARQLWNRMRSAGLATDDPRPGDLIFFWREKPSSWKGHVGIVIEINSNQIITIEGNVKGLVKKQYYPKEGIPRLLGFGRI